MAKIKTIIIITITALITVIAIQNTQSVIFRILFWEITMPRIVMLALIFIAGIVIGFLLAIFRRKPAVSRNTGKQMSRVEPDRDEE